jgi:hypothetical protein
MDKISLFPCNIETNEATNNIISLVYVGILNEFNKMAFVALDDFLKQKLAFVDKN